MLLRRPIIGFFPDYDDYDSGRGFIYDYLEIFPGRVARSFDELGVLLENALREKNFVDVDRLETALSMFHQFGDSMATERLVSCLGSRLGLPQLECSQDALQQQ